MSQKFHKEVLCFMEDMFSNKKKFNLELRNYYVKKLKSNYLSEN